MDLHKLSLNQQLNGLKEGDFTSTELTSHYLDQDAPVQREGSEAL